MKAILDQFIHPPVRLPATLLNRFKESKTCAPYLVSCLQKGRFLHLSSRFEKITGYPGRQFTTGGVPFWFSLIHPADMQSVTNAIARAHHQLATTNTPPVEPLQLEYRIKRPDGTWLWIRELKLIVSYRDGQKDCILGCLCDISAEKAAEQVAIDRLLQKRKSANGLLETAATYQLDEHGHRKAGHPATKVISARENDVLRLVAAGCSSKQIASRLSISENTVETHRRHLLAKLKVNNSTALIKTAHQLGLI